MVNVNGKLVPSNQMFTVQLDSYGDVQVDAAQAAVMYQRMNAGNPGNTNTAGEIQGITMGKEVAAPAAPAPAAPAPAQRRAPAKSALTAPPQPNLPAVTDPITKKERDEVSKPAKGLENTIKTSPTLLREKRRKSYLTAGG